MANPIVFRRNADIGAADAESDASFLKECFVDTGDLGVLLDCTSPRCIVLGRTGSGKTALVSRVLDSTENGIELSPASIGLNFVSNSEVIRFFEEAGVNLDMFYSLLWRHIIAVELLRARYEITSIEKQREFLQKIKSIFFRDKTKERAIEYLTEWGSKFWEETQYRTKEFTRKLETDLKANAKIKPSVFELGVEGARKLSEEEKIEVRHHGTTVINGVQVKELHAVIEFLANDVFTDNQKNYYITIDHLDEEWVSERLKSKLIKALIETIRSFKKVTNIKIIIALRSDLHQRVLAATPSPGFQEEKYRSLYLNLKWTRPQIVELLDRRVTKLFKRQYTNDKINITDILPNNQMDRKTALDYVIDRTFFRPREAILFVNECIERSEGASRITKAIFQQAEQSYSKQRLASLGTEWLIDYPSLVSSTEILKQRISPFYIGDISHEDAERFAVKLLEAQDNTDEITRLAESFALAGNIGKDEFLDRIFSIFYQVGLVGLKFAPHLSRQWSFFDEPIIGRGQIGPTTAIEIHKTFWAALGCYSRTSDRGRN